MCAAPAKGREDGDGMISESPGRGEWGLLERHWAWPGNPELGF